MARALVLCPDLLFGSRIEGGLGAAGHEVVRVGNVEAARSALAAGTDVLVVDLSAEGIDGAGLVESLRAADELGAVATLGFYPHVEQETRARAQAAGFDLVVPRSRMVREMGALVERVAPATGVASGPGTGAEEAGAPGAERAR